MNCSPFYEQLRKNLGWFLSQHRKTLCLTDSISWPRKTRWILLKSGTKDFKNSLPFEKSACFCATTTGNFECVHYFIFEINFLKNENLFENTGVPFFSSKYYFHKTLPCQKPLLRQIQWEVQNVPITKDKVLPVTTLFF